MAANDTANKNTSATPTVATPKASVTTSQAAKPAQVTPKPAAKTAAKKAEPKKTTAKKTVAKKNPAKKTVKQSAKKAVTKKTATKKKPAAKTAKKTVKQSAKKAANTNRAVAKKASKLGMKTLKQTQKTTDEMMQVGMNSMQDFVAKTAHDFREAQEKWLTMTGGQAYGFSVSPDQVTEKMQHMMEAGRENAEALVESGNILGDATRDVTEAMYQMVNSSFTKQLEYSKDILSCRTLNDAVELQSRFVQSNCEDALNDAMALSDMTFRTAQEVMEPVQERAQDLAKKLYKPAA
jgi:phasin family protein